MCCSPHPLVLLLICLLQYLMLQQASPQRLELRRLAQLLGALTQQSGRGAPVQLTFLLMAANHVSAVLSPVAMQLLQQQQQQQGDNAGATAAVDEASCCSLLHAFAVGAAAAAAAGGDLAAPLVAVQQVLQVVYVLQQQQREQQQQQQQQRVHPQAVVEFLKSQQLIAASNGVYWGETEAAAEADAVASPPFAAAAAAAAGGKEVTIFSACGGPVRVSAYKEGLTRKLLGLRDACLHAAAQTPTAAAEGIPWLGESPLASQGDLLCWAAKAETLRQVIEALPQQHQPQQQQQSFSLRQLLSIAYTIVRGSKSPSLLLLSVSSAGSCNPKKREVLNACVSFLAWMQGTTPLLTPLAGPLPASPFFRSLKGRASATAANAATRTAAPPTATAADVQDEVLRAVCHALGQQQQHNLPPPRSPNEALQQYVGTVLRILLRLLLLRLLRLLLGLMKLLLFVFCLRAPTGRYKLLQTRAVHSPHFFRWGPWALWRLPTSATKGAQGGTRAFRFLTQGGDRLPGEAFGDWS